MTELVDEVAADVFFCRGADVNWILLRAGRDVTLIDTGYPGYLETVQESIRAVGSRPEDVVAVLITHAHVDHVGGANHFADTYGTPIYTDPVEVRHAHRDYLEQATPLDVARNVWRPGMLPWLSRVMRVGVTKKVTLPSAQPFPDDGALDLPGRPVPVPTHGHTSGHTAYYLPSAKAVATGDELVTGHALLREDGPAILPAFFNHGDPRAAIKRFEDLDADLVLPGHGATLRQPIRDAVADALAR